jgi:hypothetical protein
MNKTFMVALHGYMVCCPRTRRNEIAPRIATKTWSREGDCDISDVKNIHLFETEVDVPIEIFQSVHLIRRLGKLWSQTKTENKSCFPTL